MNTPHVVNTALGAALVAALGASHTLAQDAPPLALDAVASAAEASSASAATQQDDEHVAVPCTVTGVAGASVFVDVGSDDGLEPGDRVRIEPVGRPAVIAAVRAVSSGSARLEIESGGPVDVGDTGNVFVPRARFAALEQRAAASGDVPAHPPWTHPPEEWSSDKPLLAPSTSAKEREATRKGSLFAQFDATFDREGGDSTSTFARTGLDAEWWNQLGRGETIEFDGEIVARAFDTDADSDDETRLRLQRLSYSEGGDREQATRWQAGRFLQSGFVEFGLLDGVEVTRRVSGPWHVGASLGLLPEPTFELGSGDDLQIAFFARRERTTSTGIAYGIGYQKSFHHGDADRDLLALDADWAPTKAFTLHSNALVDFYTSDERAKSAGLELTELHLFGNWRVNPRTNVSLSHDRTRLPDVLRAGFEDLPADVLASERFERTGARVQHRFTDDFRLSARADLWRNEYDDGAGGELRGDWKGLPWQGANFAAALFTNEGSFTDVTGVRFVFDQYTSVGSWRLAWEIAQSALSSAVVGDDTLLEQSLRASWDHGFGRTSVSLYLEQFFGDGQDATSLGLYVRRGL
jgi:protein involved in polysaccharide export with SLBB domain